ncbi:MAG: sulfatase-like hydrolase/transferase [Eggerthellaceae bacterium]|nr:sulfatase-like hydrolase/transferase [Eggerthellaceae bacterium]
MLKLKGDVRAIVGVVVYCALLCAYCFYDFSGLVLHDAAESVPTFFVVGAFLLMIGVCIFRRPLEGFVKNFIKRFQKPYWVIIYKVVVCLILVAFSFYLIERPFNEEMLRLSASFVTINLCILAVLFGIVYFVGQQTKGVVMGFLTLCFLIGLANYFVLMFKGQPILPADFFALKTAASVSGGYVYLINGRVVRAILAFAFSLLLASFLPRVPKARLKLKPIFANLGVALGLVLAFGLWFANVDIEQTHQGGVNAWNPRVSYEKKGTILCFLKRTQDLFPHAPHGYSPEAAAALLAPYQESNTGEAVAEKPTIVVVMNESFVDYSRLSILSDNYEGPAYYQSLAANTLSGTIFVSAYGGGTCNSEFEFLTGSSLGSIGRGVYPYAFYDLNGVDSLVSYFNALDYETIALHPAPAENWRRDVVYEQLGFDSFLDEEDFPDAEIFRDKPTDRETYSKLLQLLRKADGPQFIFNVTYQNHSGYDTGLVPDNALVSAPIKGSTDSAFNAELEEFLSCIQQSDQDLRYLIRGLEDIDKDIILCFFGDHQPGLGSALARLEFGKTAEDFELAEVQTYYSTPYMLWRNNGAAAGGGGASANDAGNGAGATSDFDTSLNYLGVLLLQEAGLPLTPYQRFLVDTREQMPAVNLCGYQDALGTWYWIGEKSALTPVYDAYAIVQHDNLFNKARPTLPTLPAN